jgi:hypothetical protein
MATDGLLTPTNALWSLAGLRETNVQLVLSAATAGAAH